MAHIYVYKMHLAVKNNGPWISVTTSDVWTGPGMFLLTLITNMQKLLHMVCLVFSLFDKVHYK